MRAPLQILLAAGLAALLSGCTHPFGLIYTHTVEPLDINFDQTVVVTDPQKMRSGDMIHFRYYLEGEWGSNAITEIARNNGIAEVLYADLETVRVIWYLRREIVHIYGR